MGNKEDWSEQVVGVHPPLGTFPFTLTCTRRVSRPLGLSPPLYSDRRFSSGVADFWSIGTGGCSFLISATNLWGSKTGMST